MRFCGQCGSALGQGCSVCGTHIPAGFRFCGQCGSPLNSPSPLPQPAIAAPAHETQDAEQAERRQITVLFCDLVDSTRLSEQLDPEELRDLLFAYQTAAGSVVERHYGTIAQYLGDGLLIYFGYPTARDDDAQRAVNSGLEILDALSCLNNQYPAKNITIQARIGIHTGLGVAGSVGAARGKREQLVIGKTPNVAAHLQGLADSNSIVISDATWRLVAEYFDCEPLGQVKLKGMSGSLEAHKVLQKSGVQGRFQASVRRGLLPIVGREAEMQMLEDRFSLTLAGQGQTVLLRAEAGIGKSHLVHEFQNECRGRALLMSAGCTATGENAALLPVIETFRQFLSIEPDDSDAITRPKIAHFLSQAGESTPENLSLLCAFLSVPSNQPALALPAPKQRELTIRLLVRLLTQAAERRPVLVVFEDLHWVDPSSMEFISILIEEGSHTRLLLLLTSRPEFVPPWNFRPYITCLDLQRLAAAEIERVVLAISGKPIPEAVMRQLIEKSDGVPLFVEELTRATLESGVLQETSSQWELARSLESSSIPASLRDSLMGRLDRLGPAKDVAQIASAIGRFFPYKLIASVCRQLSQLRRHLDQLQNADIIQIEDRNPVSEVYGFKHALIQDTAYESMLRSRRREIHEALARTIEADFPELAQSRPELMALHFFEAGFVETSVDYRLKAGLRLMQSGAYSEAIAELNHGIQGLQGLAPSASNYSQEAELRAALGGCLVATRGYCAPEVEENVQRSRDLCGLLKNPTSKLIPTLYGLWVVNLASSRVGPTVDYARQLAEYATPEEEPHLKVTIHFANGTTLLYRGRFDDSRRELQRAISFYDPSMHTRMVSSYGDDHGLFSSIYLQWLEGLTGHVDKALKISQFNLQTAKQLDNPLSLALALTFAMILHHDMRQPQKAAEFAARNIELCGEQGFAFWGSLSKIGLGWAQVSSDGDESGLAVISSGLAFFDLIQQKLPLAYWKSYLVEAHLHTGNWQAGLDVVDEALALSAANLDRMYHPELLRLKGDLLQLRKPGGSASRDCYREAVALARGSGAALLELRAAVSLAKVMGRKAKEGKTALQQALDKMQDGFESRDVEEALALQAALG
jgi:class 3 adenylate cyclase/tetratricopeptide (TPR) repeat protein